MIWLVCVLIGTASAQELFFPDPKITIDYRAFGDVSKDVNAKRKFLRAVTRNYIEQYIQEFLAKNHIKENLFPNKIITASVNSIDAMPDALVMKADNSGYGLLKVQMDKAAGFYYQHMMGANRADKNKMEILGELRAIEKRAVDALAQRDEALKKVLLDADSRYKEFVKKTEARLKELEAKSGVSSPPPAPAVAPTPVVTTNKSDRALVIAAFAMSVFSLLLGLRKKS